MKRFSITTIDNATGRLRFATLSTSLSLDVSFRDEIAHISLFDDYDGTNHPFTFTVEYNDPKGVLNSNSTPSKIIKHALSEMVYAIIYAHIAKDETTRAILPLNIEIYTEELRNMISGYIKSIGTSDSAFIGTNYALTSDDMSDLLDRLSEISDGDYADRMATGTTM